MIATPLAQMWEHGDHMDGGWWWVMGIGWLVFLGLIVIVVWLFIRQSRPHGQAGAGGGTSRALDVLGERLARGEIDEDEYRRRRDALRE